MTGSRLNQINAAVFAVIQSLIPALILLGVLDWTTDTTAAVLLVVTNTLTLVGLIFAQSSKTNT